MKPAKKYAEKAGKKGLLLASYLVAWKFIKDIVMLEKWKREYSTYIGIFFSELRQAKDFRKKKAGKFD